MVPLAHDALIGGLQVPVGGEESPVQVTVPWQVIAVAGAVVLIIILAILIAAIVWARRMRRRPEWQQRRLQIEQHLLPDNARRTLIGYRLRLGEAIDTAQSIPGTDGADIGEIRTLSMQLRDIGQRIIDQLDALLRAGAAPSPTVMTALDDRVREIETAARTLVDAVTIAATGSTEIEIAEIQRDIHEQLDFVAARTDALRELTTGTNPIDQI